MPDTKYLREYTDGVLTAEIPYEVSDEELTEETEVKLLSDIIQKLPDANPLKMLWDRLIKKGLLP